MQPHAAHYLTQSGQDKQMTQPNLLMIRITLFLTWMHTSYTTEWDLAANSCLLHKALIGFKS